MLVLSRKKLESIVIDGRITATILEYGARGVRLGMAAPPEVGILRQELVLEYDKIERQRNEEVAELACAAG